MPRLGVISHYAGFRSSREELRDTVELACAAGELGFDSFWIAQHHFGAQHGHSPAPLVVLAAIAERTSRIRLGTAVVVGSLEDPIRLAEDAATVDALSGGRLELGLGVLSGRTSGVRGPDDAGAARLLDENVVGAAGPGSGCPAR